MALIRQVYYYPFQGWSILLGRLPGATRFALAPGCHITRLRRVAPG